MHTPWHSHSSNKYTTNWFCTNMHKMICTNIFIAILFIITPHQKQVSINTRMDKWTGVCSQNEILHDNQYKWTTALCNYISEAHKYNSKWNKSDTTIYVKF